MQSAGGRSPGCWYAHKHGVAGGNQTHTLTDNTHQQLGDNVERGSFARFHSRLSHEIITTQFQVMNGTATH